MLGTLDPKKKKAVVIGAGVSGLLIAERLLTLGYDVQVHEASSRVGGLIQTRSNSFGMIESAAHSLMMTDELVKEFDRLGVALSAVHPKSRARFIFRNQKPRRMPLSFFEILRTLVHFFSKPRLQASQPKSNQGSFTLQEWGNAFLGEAATKYLLAPFVTGVFACTPAELEVSIAFPNLPTDQSLSLFRSIRSRKKKKEKTQMMVPSHGMESLILALSKRLEGRIHLNSSIKQLASFQDSNIIIATPALAASHLLQTLDAQSADALKKVKYAPLISATVFFDKSAFHSSPSGVGVLSPRGEGLRSLGVLFNSSSFPYRTHLDQHHSFTVMIGGTTDAESLDLTDLQIQEIIKLELPLILQNQEPPLAIEITRWKNAIPVYNYALHQARISLESGWCKTPGNIIFSNYSKEVSIRGMMQSLPR